MPGESDTQRRLGLIAIAATSLTLGNVAWDVLGPLWATAELGLAPDEWARLRALRFTGTLAGTIAIGLAAGVWGARSVGIAALAVAGVALASVAAWGRPGLAVALPVFGAAISAVFVALNTLIQQTGREQQARANSIYRSVGAGVACIVPVLATAAAGLVGYAWALGGAAVLLGSGSLALWFLPAAATPRPTGIALLFAGLIAPLRHPRLRSFMLLDQSFALVMTGGAAFIALILARNLGLSDHTVGVVLTCGAIAGFVGALLSHRIQLRLGPQRTILASWAAGMAATLALAWADGPGLATTAIILANLAGGVGSAPGSFVVARLGSEGSEAQTFTVWKVFQGFSAVAGLQLCALLEPHLGMTGVLAWGAAAALLPWLAMLRWSRRTPVS